MQSTVPHHNESRDDNACVSPPSLHPSIAPPRSPSYIILGVSIAPVNHAPRFLEALLVGSETVRHLCKPLAWRIQEGRQGVVSNWRSELPCHLHGWLCSPSNTSSNCRFASSSPASASKNKAGFLSCSQRWFQPMRSGRLAAVVAAVAVAVVDGGGAVVEGTFTWTGTYTTRHLARMSSTQLWEREGGMQGSTGRLGACVVAVCVCSVYLHPHAGLWDELHELWNAVQEGVWGVPLRV